MPPLSFAALSVVTKEALSTPPGYAYDSHVAVSPATNEIFCCWCTKIGDVPEVVWRQGIPGEFSEPVAITDVDGRRSWNPSLAAGPDGRVHFAHMDQKIDGLQKEIYVKAWSDGSWGSETLLSLDDGWTGWDPDVAVYPDGRPAVCWFDHRFRVQHEILLRVGDGNGNWGPDVRMTKDDFWQYFPDIAIDSDSVVHLSYVDAREQLGDEDVDHYGVGKNLETYYRTWNGTSLSPEVRITWTPLRSVASQIAVDNARKAHLIWLDESAKGWWRLYYTRIESGQPCDPIPVSNTNKRADLSAVACLGSRTFMAYPEYDDPHSPSTGMSRLYVREVLPDGRLGTPLVLAVSGTNVHPRMAADPSRKMLWVIWMEYLGEDETFTTGDSNIWLSGIKVDEQA